MRLLFNMATFNFHWPHSASVLVSALVQQETSTTIKTSISIYTVSALGDGSEALIHTLAASVLPVASHSEYILDGTGRQT